MLNHITLTIKPTMSCNMNCKHCFNGDSFTNIETLDVAQACLFIEKACLEYKNVKVVFHGGEPTLIGFEFFKEIFDTQLRLKNIYGTIFSNTITTNGLLLNDELINLFFQNKVHINISFDGPYNSCLRQQTSKVFNNILKVRDIGCSFRCFCTISKDSVSNLLDIYEWFKHYHLHFKTLPIEKRGYAKNNIDLIMPPIDLINNFEKVYRVWIKDCECDISYSTMEQFAIIRSDSISKKSWFEDNLTLNPDGLIYVFGRPNDVNYCLGNPNEISKLSDCFDTPEYKKLLQRLQSIRNSRCPQCKSYKSCGGNNINYAYLYVSDYALIDYSCYQASLIDERILKVNDEIISDFKRGDSNKYNNFIKKVFGQYSSINM